jgi:predicted TIM-barrel fold metal-dependent hydrolase
MELGVPFCQETGAAAPRTGRPIPYRRRGAGFQLDRPGHIGYPWTLEMISLARKYENVYIDTSAYTVKRYPPELVEYMRGSGRRKVMFGTNYPMLTPAKCLEGLDELGFDEETKRMFLYENAMRVFGLNEG